MFWKFSRRGSAGIRRANRHRKALRRLQVEGLEPRQLLSASSFKPDYYVIKQAAPTNAGYIPSQIRTAYGLSSTVGSEAWNSRDLKSRPH